MPLKLTERRAIFHHLNTRLAEHSDANLIKKVQQGLFSEGWGGNSKIKVDGHKVFVKVVPLTRKEHENSFDTRNLFQLPLYYNYGVGSAGFGAFRELVAHIKTTNWVLNNQCSHFPLLYHYRIVPNTKGKEYSVSRNPAKYAKAWNDSKAIASYVKQRKKPAFEVLLFLEYIPHVLHRWIEKQPSQIQKVSDQMFQVFEFLQKQNVLHFDAHWGNILTDGQRPYLTDFGLLLDREYCKTQSEVAFFNAHKYYDHSEYIGCMSYMLEDIYQKSKASQKKQLYLNYGITKDIKPIERVSLLVSHIDSIVKGKQLSMDKRYADFVKNQKTVMLASNDFFQKLRSQKKSTRHYDRKSTFKALKAAGAV